MYFCGGFLRSSWRFLFQIQKAVSARMEYNTSLEQDYMEGVDANGWEE